MRKFKRFVATLSLCAMAMSLIACGDNDEKETTTEVTTEAATMEEDTSSIEIDDNGMATLLGKF